MRDAPVSYAGAFGANDRSILILADDDAAGGAIEAAVDAAGARPMARITLGQARERLAMQARVQVIAVDVTGAEDTLAGAALDAVAESARTHHAVVVASFDPSQIDLVEAALDGVQAELLCQPSIGERVAAFALIAPPAAILNDAAREAESRRLRHINDEVARIAETLARLARAEPFMPASSHTGGVGDPGRVFHAAPTRDDDSGVQVADVRAAIRARRMRDQFFDGTLFADPAWDMLLDLFAAHLDRVRVSVSSLCIAAAVPATTALRWITTMREAGLFERQDDPFDRRRAYVALSGTAVSAMHGYVGALQKAGLSIP